MPDLVKIQYDFSKIIPEYMNMNNSKKRFAFDSETFFCSKNDVNNEIYDSETKYPPQKHNNRHRISIFESKTILPSDNQ